MISITSGAKAAPEKSLIRDPPPKVRNGSIFVKKMPSDQENARAGVLFQVGVLCPSPGARPGAGGPRGADETQLKLSVNSR